MFLPTDKGECVDVAFVAQGLEHWSCKPGVESSNLSEGFSTTAAQLSDKEQNWFFSRQRYKRVERVRAARRVCSKYRAKYS